MNFFDSIELRDCWPYKKAQLKIKPGITALYGINRTRPHSRNANAAGKSFLGSQFAEILTEEPVIGLKQDKVKKGTRTLNMRTYLGEPVKIVRKNARSELYVNNVLVSTKTPAIRKKLNEMFPFSAEDIATYISLDSRRPHPFVMGTDAQRRKFFTSFFNIDDIDDRRKIIATELRELKKVRAVYEEQRRNYKEHKDSLAELEKTRGTEQQMSKLQKQIDKAMLIQQEHSEYRRFKAFMEHGKDAIEYLDSIKADHSLEGIEAALDANKKQQKQLRDTLEKIDDYQHDLRAYKKWKEAIAEVPKEYLRYMKNMDKLRKLAKSYEDTKWKLDRQDTDKPVAPKKVKDPGVDIDKLTSDVRAYKHSLQHSQKFGKGVCSECGQSVKVKDPAKLKKLLTKAQAQLKQAQDYEEYKEEVRAYKKDMAAYKEKQAEAKQLQEKASILKKYKAAYAAVRDLPSKPDFEKLDLPSAKEVRKQIDALQEGKRHLTYLLNNSEFLGKKMKAPKEDVPDVTALNERLTSMRVTEGKYAMIERSMKRCQKRLKELKAELKEEAPLTVLAEAYGNKAGKKMIMESISALLVAEINKYARLAFPEDMVFSLEWTDTKCMLLCKRNEAHGTEISDVRKLSGAQHTLFVLVFVMACLTFVPASKRSNLLVFDEPSSNMHDETKEPFFQLLQSMTSVIPSILIITPHSTERYPGARCYTVVKEKGFSRLEKGHPESIVL